MLAGPGTGKTTTLVEAVAERVRRGTDPERVLVLTFSRKAAVELRDRMAARMAGTAPQATTFHSYCYALVRSHQDAELFAEPLRLLSGPEQDLYIRELLAGQLELERAGRGRVGWPDDLRACLTTRGFADEVRAVLARSRELGLGPHALAGFARRTGRPDWSAAAGFLAEYLDVLDLHGVLDYAELVHRAVLLAERAEPHGAAGRLAGAYDAIYVDEYQDTDPAQVRLLQALGGSGTVVAFGDPDQSIYAFRGADVGGILDFPRTFPGAGVKVLTRHRRSAGELLAATRRLTARMPLTRLPAAAVRAHRDLASTRPGGRVEAYTYPTAGAELDNIADLLRRAHLEDGVPWSSMAVLVRAGSRSLPALRRVLTSAGVPVEVAGDDLPLRREPAVAPLLAALRVVAGGAVAGVTADAAVSATAVSPADDGPPPADSPPEPPADAAPGTDGPPADAAPAPTGGGLDTATALSLLASPLGGMDAADLRRLGRALREEDRAAGRAVPRPSDELLAEALDHPERLVAHDPGYARGAQRLGLLLRKTRELLAGGGTAEQALWELWDGTPWPQRLERAARRGGAAGRNADRDLDAVCALFEVAARAEERIGGRGALNFLEELDAQDIVADTLAGRAVRPEAVRLMTAHRAKGLEWPLVVVAGVQEGLWPDLRRRGSLLEADRIGRDGLAEPLTPGALLAEERRLFYVAATRARDRLVVTAVKAAADDGDQPSRFLTELGVEPRDVPGRPPRPLAVAALVAELRSTTVDPAASPALRAAAAERLATLAALRDEEGNVLVPSAHPSRWWGLHEPTRSEVPLRDRDQPVLLSGSALGQLDDTCSLQWFLGREVKADAPATAAQGFGNVLHVLADEVATGATPADLPVLLERLDSVWDALAFEAPWKSRQEKDSARAALERFLRWHVQERGGRRTAASEHAFDVTLPAGEFQVRIRGSVDRVEQDAEGRAYVVDFKTGKAKPTGPQVALNPQLAVYQLAVREGGTRPDSAEQSGPGPGGGVSEEARPDSGGSQTPAPSGNAESGAEPAGVESDGVAQAGVELGGAELVHLRLGATAKEGGDAYPAVQRQDALAPAGPDGDWVGDLLTRAAGRVLDERFSPSPGQHCGHCAFRAACSARPEGRQVVE